MARKLPQPITHEDFEKLLTEAKKQREYFRKPSGGLSPRGERFNQYIIAMVLAYGAGMRISEIIGFKDKVPILTKDKVESNFIRVVSGKGGKDRQVPLPGKLFIAAGVKREDFRNNLPLTVSRRAIQTYFEQLGDKVLKKHITFHMFRHGFVTHALESGIDIHQVQMFAGHSRMDTTGLYLHANPKQALDKYEEKF